MEDNLKDKILDYKPLNSQMIWETISDMSDNIANNSNIDKLLYVIASYKDFIKDLFHNACYGTKLQGFNIVKIKRNSNNKSFIDVWVRVFFTHDDHKDTIYNYFTYDFTIHSLDNITVPYLTKLFNNISVNIVTMLLKGTVIYNPKDVNFDDKIIKYVPFDVLKTM